MGRLPLRLSMPWLPAALAVAILGALALSLLPPHIAPPPRSDLVITGVTIIHPGGGRAHDQTIIIRDGLISDIRDTNQTDPPPVCAGCFALPGLIDAHVHSPPAFVLANQDLFGLLYLAHGVTSIRDVGQSDASIATWSRAIEQGKRIGRRVYRCGPVVDGNDPGWPSARTVSTPAAGVALVKELAREGVDCIKVYNHVDRSTFEALAREARTHSLPVIGHVPHLVGLGHLSDFEAQHLTGLPYLHRQPRWDWDVESADLANMSDGQIAEALELAARQRVSLTPTIINLRTRLSASDPMRFPVPPSARELPALWSIAWPNLVGHPEGEKAIADQLRAADRSREIIAEARARGVDVLAGTDTLMPWTIPGEALLGEIDELAAGFGAAEAALEAATRINGKHIDRGHIGVIAIGARADLIILSADPARDLSALRQWTTVIADGRAYDRNRLETALRAYRAYFARPTYRMLFGGVAHLATSSFKSNSDTEN